MQVKIDKMDNFGRGITYINNKICFVENALENETVEIEIIKEKKKYSEAKVLNILTKSKERIKAACPYSNQCGGCNLNHLKYQEENKLKEEKIKSLTEKFSNLSKDIVENITYHDEYNYRNKIVLHGKNNELGLYQQSTKSIVKIERCLLVNNKINKIIKILNKINENIEEVTIKTSNDEKNALVDIKGTIKSNQELLEIVNVLIINNQILTKEKAIKTNIGPYQFLESSNSFFQINKTLTEELYNYVKLKVQEQKPNKVLDLYCGTGTIGIYISNFANEIIGIDCNESNIKDALKNKALNQLKNINFICNKVENEIENFKDIDLIIVDPPRKGLDEKTKKHLKIINPKTIIYVSCDPVTLIRDLNDLENNYIIKTIKPFNMFPRTYHCESIAVLERK